MNINFTIITSTLNCFNELQKTIKSISKIDRKDFEYIVIDGNSSDQTKDLIINSKLITRYLIEKDNGIYDAWNKGLKLSRGNWIMFLGAGDIIFPNLLDNYNFFLDKKSGTNFDFIHCNILLGNKTINSFWTWKIFKKYMNIPHCGGIHNKNYFIEYGEFDDEFQIAGDYEILLRKKKELNVGKINSTGIIMAEDGISQNNWRAVAECHKAQIKNLESYKFQACLNFTIAYIKIMLKNIFNEFIQK